MRISSYFQLFLVLVLCCAKSAAYAENASAYVIEEQGRSTFRSLFDSRKSTPEEQWDYASRTRDAGNLKKAERRMLYLYRRWPNSKEAPWATRARADMLFERRQWEESFEVYQYLIDNYSSRMEDYDSVLGRQFEIAVRIMKRHRMKWLMGGFEMPEYAIEYFEQVIQNGPQWPGAPEAQFMIGQCSQSAGDYELAITAYAVLGYRYPDSQFAEEAAWQQILCLNNLRDEYPSSPELLERTLTASTVFLSNYPKSANANLMKQMRNDLYEVMAGRIFDEAVFYERVPKQYEAAVLCYKRMIEEYPKSKLVDEALKQIAEIQVLLAKPIQDTTADAPYSKPVPFIERTRHVDG